MSEKSPHTAFALSLFIPLLSVSTVFATEIKDPTKPAYQVQETVTGDEKAEQELVLSAIWIGRRTRWAAINGKYGKQGQTILDNVKIIRIRKNTVTVDHNGKRKTLKLVSRLDESR